MRNNLKIILRTSSEKLGKKLHIEMFSFVRVSVACDLNFGAAYLCC